MLAIQTNSGESKENFRPLNENLVACYLSTVLKKIYASKFPFQNVIIFLFYYFYFFIIPIFF